MNKKKILLISDDIRAHSGVATMARYIIEETRDRFEWVEIGSLAVHPENGKIVEANGVRIYATEQFGSIELLRHVLHAEKPDAIMLFTDPRFYQYIWAHEDEIRSRVPIYYYNIWDGGPPPLWNLGAWSSCDRLGAISRQTYALNGAVVPNVPRAYIPHGTDLDVYHPLPDAESLAWLKEKTKIDRGLKVLFVNRNIRRKSPADLIVAVSRLIEATGDRTISLLMRTDPVDGDGTDLPAVLEGVGFRGRVAFFGALDEKEMNLLYNASDVTVNIASNEGFGITTIESLASGTPILVNMTGGLQDQAGLTGINGFPVTLADYTPKWYTNSDGRFRGHGVHANVVFPKARTVNGSPSTPYVLQEFCSHEDVAEELFAIYTESREARKARGLAGRAYLVAQGMTRQIMGHRIAEEIERMISEFTPRPGFALVDSRHNPYTTNPGTIPPAKENS